MLPVTLPVYVAINTSISFQGSYCEDFKSGLSSAFSDSVSSCTRRLNSVLCRPKGERLKEFRLTGIDPESVHYYDIASGSLDIRPIGQVYGVPNFYQDVHNIENIDELEDKLATLENQAASIIEDIHRALPRGTFILKRRSLELLRKFLFILHHREVSCSTHYFQADHPESAITRQWVECFMQAKGIQSAGEAWLHVLRYYLDTSHSDIMLDAAGLIEKYGLECLQKMISESHIPPDLELYPTVTYQGQANNHFLSIWEAAEGEEFILTHNGFGLSEGLANGFPGLHRIFVVSPHIAIVLCNTLLRPELKGRIEPELRSSLLDVNAALATPIYADGGDSLRANSKSVASLTCYMSSQKGANDSFVFKTTKLTRPQTLELNSVLLLNMKERGSLTFLSRESMLHTARAFLNSQSNCPQSKLVVPLIGRLTTSMEAELSTLRPLQSPAAVRGEDIDAFSLVDVVLYVLLMQICTGRRQFTSAYDRAHLVLKIMERAKPTSFADEISGEVEKAFRACKEVSEDAFLEGVNFPPLLSSIPEELSSELFPLMMPYMVKLGAVMSGDDGILEELRNEVAVVSFLTRASCSPGVWHTLSYSSTEAPGVLAKLFKENTQTDELVTSFTDFHYKKGLPSVFTSCYDRAHALRSICGLAGPTTNLFSQSYFELTAAMTGYFGRANMDLLPAPYSSQPCERPKARLVPNMSEAHSDLLLSNMKTILQITGYTPSPGEDTGTNTIKKWLDEMAIVNALAWLGRHRRNFLDFVLERIVPEMDDFKLFEDEEVSGST
jgi:hypothetical protein